MSGRRTHFLNYFKHVPDDLVTSSTAGMVISLVGTLIMVTLFLFEVNEYFQVKATTNLVVDEFHDDTIRANFNITLHQVPCEHLSIDVSDMTGTRCAQSSHRTLTTARVLTCALMLM